MKKTKKKNSAKNSKPKKTRPRPSACSPAPRRPSSTSPNRGTVRVYRPLHRQQPAAVKIGLKLRGRKGALTLGGDQERFKRAGVYRQTERLSDPQMAKVVAAKSFTVALRAVNTPRYCHRYFDSELTVRRASGGGLTWSAPAARSGA